VRKHFYTATKCEPEFRALFSLPFDMAKGCRVIHHKRRPVEINVLRLVENALIMHLQTLFPLGLIQTLFPLGLSAAANIPALYIRGGLLWGSLWFVVGICIRFRQFGNDTARSAARQRVRRPSGRSGEGTESRGRSRSCGSGARREEADAPIVPRPWAKRVPWAGAKD